MHTWQSLWRSSLSSFRGAVVHRGYYLMYDTVLFEGCLYFACFAIKIYKDVLEYGMAVRFIASSFGSLFFCEVSLFL